MSYNQIIILLGYIFWFFPVLKQKGTKYFSVFFIYSISDPLRIILYEFFGLMPLTYYPLTSMAVLFLLSSKNYKYFVASVGISSLLILNLYKAPYTETLGATAAVHLLITFVLSYQFFTRLKETGTANLFLGLFIIYEFISVIKLITVFNLPFQVGVINRNLSTFFQFFFAISFTFINIDTKNYSLKFLLKEETDT